VAAGDIAPGLRELDHATAAAVAGEFSGPHFAGAVCCHMIYACERVHDVERAAQWCETVRDFSEQGNVPQLFGFCRSHYASVLMWRGEWAEAEAELDAATRAFERGAPALVYEGILRLAQLRLRQGRVDEAVELCERIPWHPAAQLCLAEITLERGDTETARDLVDRHLRALPAAERLGRAPGLELAARVDIASGDLPAAEERCAELEALADAAGTAPLRASLRFARGLAAKARGDVAGARRELVDAVDLWSRLEAPFELARGRLELAEVALGLERADEAAREAAAALAALERLGAAAAAARAQALLERARGGLSVA
jgi:ATP/maltotriose-dependent transcriptional regulator MalT